MGDFVGGSADLAEDADLVEGAEGLGVCTHPDIVRHDFFGGVKTQPGEVKPSVKRIVGDATGAPGDGGVSGGVVQLERGRFAIRGHATVLDWAIAPMLLVTIW